MSILNFAVGIVTIRRWGREIAARNVFQKSHTEMNEVTYSVSPLFSSPLIPCDLPLAFFQKSKAHFNQHAHHGGGFLPFLQYRHITTTSTATTINMTTITTAITIAIFETSVAAKQKFNNVVYYRYC